MLALLAVKLLLPVRQHLTRTHTLTPTAHSLMTCARRHSLEGALWAEGVARPCWPAGACLPSSPACPWPPEALRGQGSAQGMHSVRDGGPHTAHDSALLRVPGVADKVTLGHMQHGPRGPVLRGHTCTHTHPWMQRASTMPSWPSSVFWHL